MKNWTEHTDAGLVHCCLGGDKSAFEELVRRYYQGAYAAALLRTHQPDAALDISQEAFLRVYRHLKRFDAERSFGAWLHVIVRNLCLNHLQRYGRRWTVFSDLPEGQHPEQTQQGEDGQVEANERQQLLRAALARLGEREREIILLKDIEGLSYRAIAEMLQIPQGTVMSRLYNARKKLARELITFELR